MNSIAVALSKLTMHSYRTYLVQIMHINKNTDYAEKRQYVLIKNSNNFGTNVQNGFLNMVQSYKMWMP